jgi:hypothetical protein
MRKILTGGVVVTLWAGTTVPALAADDLSSAKNIVGVACSGITERTEIEQRRLAEALLMGVGVMPSQLVQIVHEPDRPSIEDKLSFGSLSLVRDPIPLGDETAGRVEVMDAIFSDHATQVGGQLVAKLVVIGASPEQPIFDPGVRLICPGSTPLSDIAGALPSPTPRPRGANIGSTQIMIRKSVDDFVVAAKDASGSFAGSYERQRSTNLDGEKTTTETTSIRGALGVGIAGDGVSDFLIGYADYALKEVRKKTSPVPTPIAQDGRKNDVDALEIGFFGSVPVQIGQTTLRTSARLGAVYDFEKGSRRLIGGLQVEPKPLGTIGPARSGILWMGYLQ